MFLGIVLQPSVLTVQYKTELNTEPKDYLFETIIDIANNPDVKDLLEQYNNNLFTSDYDYTALFSQLLFKKPKFLISMLFTKPSITYDYLNKCYDRGIEIINILGENELIKIMKSVKVTDTELFDELNNNILNNDELSSRIDILKKINNELNSDFPFDRYPIICSCLAVIFIYEVAKFATYYTLFLHFEKTNLMISYISRFFATKSIFIVFFSFVLLEEFECIVIDLEPYIDENHTQEIDRICIRNS